MTSSSSDRESRGPETGTGAAEAVNPEMYTKHGSEADVAFSSEFEVQMMSDFVVERAIMPFLKVCSNPNSRSLAVILLDDYLPYNTCGKFH